jgi:hypothetical protein
MFRQLPVSMFNIHRFEFLDFIIADDAAKAPTRQQTGRGIPCIVGRTFSRRLVFVFFVSSRRLSMPPATMAGGMFLVLF